MTMGAVAPSSRAARASPPPPRKTNCNCNMSKAKKSAEASNSDRQHQPLGGRGTRETIESIVIAIILAFLFRAFEAEAFVIPTGSMAPTLQGQHIDTQCPMCGLRYRTGASEGRSTVFGVTCPICRYEQEVKHYEFIGGKNTLVYDEPEYDGDRILVSKFAYELGSPQRWDVIVFKFPGNAKQNYIKRLIGLPGEQIRIYHGNIYVRREGEVEHIARKTEHSPAKLKAMLQMVDDTEFIPDPLRLAGWPSRWQAWSPSGDGAAWSASDDGHVFETDGEGGESWLRYHHIVPDDDVWVGLDAWNALSDPDALEINEAAAVAEMLGMDLAANAGDVRNVLLEYDANGDRQLDAAEKRAALKDRRRGELITDFYAYNDASYSSGVQGAHVKGANGLNWVGDLAVESEIEVLSDGGELIFNLVKSGVNHQVRIDVAEGTAKLSLDDGAQSFVDDQGEPVETPTATSVGIQGPGRYQVRFANVDNQLVLWVNDRPITFDGPTTFVPDEEAPPFWTPEDPGDLAPVGVGSNGAAVRVNRLRVLRDVYYIAVWNEPIGLDRNKPAQQDYRPRYFAEKIWRIMRTPEEWATTPLFADRQDLLLPEHGPLNNDPAHRLNNQYLPLGDNSPQSSDARMWLHGPYVEQKMLLGKALFIYWPHPWKGFLPNFSQMGFIR
jgi:signal peptidase I